jgi:hypothetical protein
MKKNIMITLVLFALLMPNLANSCIVSDDCHVGSFCLKIKDNVIGFCLGGMFPGNRFDLNPFINNYDSSGKGKTCILTEDCSPDLDCYKGDYEVLGVCL